MTADERIEKLIVLQGETLADLPWEHSAESRAAAKGYVRARRMKRLLLPRDYLEVVLHLTDVIDRMEMALETANRKAQLTNERAIEQLTASGWLPEHDRILTTPPEELAESDAGCD